MRGFVAAAVLFVLACGSDSVMPLREPVGGGADASGEDGGGDDSGSTQPADAGLPNVGQACDGEHGDCVAPAGGRCLSEIDPAAAIAGLLEAVADFLSTGEDAGSDEDAGALPAGETDLRVAAPGGYCSAPCTRDEECGSGGACFSSLALWHMLGFDQTQVGGFVGEPGMCLEPCDRDADCRQSEGYVCRSPLQNLFSISGSPLPLDRPLFCLPPPPGG